MKKQDVQLQRDYYRQTASRYEDMHMDSDKEHHMALAWLASLIDLNGYKSLLDIGSGTGRALQYIQKRSAIEAVGIEPVTELRDIGIANGLCKEQLVDGDATALDYADNSFDIVCEFAVLHHIKDHKKAVEEMCRVAKHAVFISDSNSFGQGKPIKRFVKQLVDAVGLWSAYDYLATGGKGHHWSKGDGLYYSYTVFRDIPVLQEEFPNLHYMTTRPFKGTNLYREAPHLAIFATRD